MWNASHTIKRGIVDDAKNSIANLDPPDTCKKEELIRTIGGDLRMLKSVI